MGSVARLRELHSLLRGVSWCSCRWFSLSSSGVVGAEAVQSKEVGVPSIGATDFVHRHSYDDGPFAAYKSGRLNGLYRRDPRQETIVLRLQELYERLAAKTPAKAMDSGLTVVDNVHGIDNVRENSGWFSGIVKMTMRNVRSSGARSRAQRLNGDPENEIQGLYLHGGVGVGKTMLMDLFVETRPMHVKVTRSHFHAFMLSIHARLKEESHNQDPLLFVAESISNQAQVLALDELFVTDVADAMIINRLFKTLWENGMLLISTSNTRPDDLYLGGLQRDLFLPFIDNLKKTCVVHDMESEVDYRRLAHRNKGIYFSGAERHRCLKDTFKDMTVGRSKKRDMPVSLQTRRKIVVPLSAGPHCYFTFDELCGKPVGAADYLGLCHYFHTVFIQDVPIINAANKSAAYRLVTLIDILYDNRIRLVCSAEGEIHELFQSVMSQTESDQKQDNGEQVVDNRLSFTKNRTVSRLTEMASLEYLVEHANRYAPELLLALAELEEKQKKKQ